MSIPPELIGQELYDLNTPSFAIGLLASPLPLFALRLPHQQVIIVLYHSLKTIPYKQYHIGENIPQVECKGDIPLAQFRLAQRFVD